MDIVQQNISKSTAPAPAADETQKARNLFAARSGKAVGPTQSAISSQAEQGANEQTNQQLGQLGQQVQLQQTGMVQQQQAQKQQEEQQRQQLTQQQSSQAQQARIQTQSILSDLERNKGQLNLEKDKARLEQLGHNMAMQDKRYVAELQRAGRQQRLDSDLGFSESMARSVLGSNTDLLKQKLGQQAILGADRRQFAERMGQLDIDSALQIAHNEMKDAQRQGMYSAASSVLSGSIGAYGSYQEGAFDSEYQAQNADNKTSKYQSYLANKPTQATNSSVGYGPSGLTQRPTE